MRTDVSGSQKTSDGCNHILTSPFFPCALTVKPSERENLYAESSLNIVFHCLSCGTSGKK